MTTQDENPLVKLIKKSVGLPTGQSGCCGRVALSEQSQSEQCCGSEPTEGKSTECCDSGNQATESDQSTQA